MLEGLQPHPNLKSIRIKWFLGKKFPSWVGLWLYHNLIETYLLGCGECEEVPTLGHLPCLRVLKIIGMWKLSIGSEFYSDGSYKNTTTLFLALRILKLDSMDSLEEWRDAKGLTSAGEVLLVFPCLEVFTICYCKKLKYFPDSLHTCISLQKLVVQKCRNLRSLPGVLSSGLQCSTSIKHSLQKLKLCGSSEYHSLDALLVLDQIQFFIALKILWIQGFPEMEALP